MGGGDSKPEEDPKPNTPIQSLPNQDSPINKQKTLPSFDNNQQSPRELSPFKRDSNINDKAIRNSSFASQPLKSQQSIPGLPPIQAQDYQQTTYFQNWDPRFHQEGSMKVKVMVLAIHPTLQFTNLQRRLSDHSGQLTWSYQTHKSGVGNELYLRLIFQEEGGYYLNFVVNREQTVLEGDQQIWQIVCPFRTQEKVIRIGGLICQRTYEQQEAGGTAETEEVDSELFSKWSEKVPDPRTNMRLLLQKKRQNLKLKSSQGLKYRQVSKYFSANNEWVFSVLIQQKQNRFKCWMIECLDPKHQQMSATVKGDIENRENMYIEQMRKKKKLSQRSQRAKRRT